MPQMAESTQFPLSLSYIYILILSHRWKLKPALSQSLFDVAEMKGFLREGFLKGRLMPSMIGPRNLTAKTVWGLKCSVDLRKLATLPGTLRQSLGWGWGFLLGAGSPRAELGTYITVTSCLSERQVLSPEIAFCLRRGRRKWGWILDSYG